MKKHKCLKSILLSLIILVMCFCPILTGCDFSLSASKLDTPEITLHGASMCLTWDKVDNTGKYEVYCNDKYVEYVSSNASLKSYLYDFSSVLTTDGVYSFYIVAVSNLRLAQDSDTSNVVTYNYTKASVSSSIVTDTSVTTSDEYAIDYNLSSTRLTYAPIDNELIEGYQLYLFSQSTGLNVYDIEGTTIELQSSAFSLKDEIYAVALGVVIGDEGYICSDVEYVNPDSYDTYTSNIYLFDGYINDYYIESLPELRNLVYYTFVSRMSTFNVKLSSSFKTSILSTYSGNNNAERLISAIIDSYSYLYETRNAYSMQCTTIEESTSQYRVYINYDDYLNSDGLPASELSNVPSEEWYLPEYEWEPFYETCSYTMRDEDSKYSLASYDDFVSDHQFLSATVSSSEELYWAVENKVTPIVTSGSMADTIYTKAKSVLNSIISDSMSDYEKVLSIFDWICANTVYDYYSLEDDSYSTESVTIVPAYYLEGVFLTGYAVCDGYSKAFSLMCNMEGIDAIRVVGTAYSGGTAGGHAWNKVLLDKDPDDGIDAQYYLVDITWTTMIGVNTNEVSSHQYFLISDANVATTHEYYAKRDKFAHYTAPDNYDYYNNTTFVYNNKTYDLVVDADDDLTAVFYYMLHNTKSSMEVVIDYNYMCDNYVSVNGSLLGATYNNVVSLMIETMRSKKFNEQYLTLNSNDWLVVTYNEAGDQGVIMVFEQSFLIDADNEAGHLIEYFSHYGIEGEFKLFATPDMLPQDDVTDYDGDGDIDYDDRVISLFCSALSTHTNVDVSFELVNVDSEEIEYKMTVVGI